MTERVIWERVIDHDKIAARKQRFLKMFLGPALLIVLVVFVLGGFGNAVGAAIVVGLVGLAWGSTVHYRSLSDQANPTMTFDGKRITLGDRSVAVEDVTRYTVLATSIQTSVLGDFSRIHLGKVILRTDQPGTRRDPQLVEFGWPNMHADEVEGIADALEPLLPGRKVAPENMLNKGERDQGSPRRRRLI